MGYQKNLLNGLISIVSVFLIACDSKSIVEKYNDKNILIIGNSAEPSGVDPQDVSGTIESNILRSMFEGLCSEHPSKEGVHEPGAAISWSSNKNFTEWTFNLQPNGKWSDGTPLTSEDFRFSYNRILNPKFAAKYASILYFIEGAERYNKNKRCEILLANSPLWETIKEENLSGLSTPEAKEEKKVLQRKFFKNLEDKEKSQFITYLGLDNLEKHHLAFLKANIDTFNWNKDTSLQQKTEITDLLLLNAGKDLWNIANVGVNTPDPYTLKLKLKAPTPFLPDITKHFTWYPLPKHVLLKLGEIHERNTGWTDKENIVGNGPFKMKDRRLDYFIEVERNPHYWDKQNVSLNGIRFLPITNKYTEARMAFNEQIHISFSLAPEMIEYAIENHPEKVRQDTYLSCSFLRFNVTNPQLKNINLRKALAHAIDAQKIIDNILKGGEKRATGIVPAMGEYIPSTIAKFDIQLAKDYLKKSGVDPSAVELVLLTTQQDQSKTLAEAYQDMWKKHLGISVTIEQREWKTYLTRLKKLEYGIATGGWIGDYPDPTTFLDMWKNGDGNNRTGWSNEAYEQQLKLAETEEDPLTRIQILQEAENLFLEETAIAPIYWANKNYLLHPSVSGWHPLLLNSHPYKHVKLNKR